MSCSAKLIGYLGNDKPSFMSCFKDAVAVGEIAIFFFKCGKVAGMRIESLTFVKDIH
ncbi:hypothetical protein D3C81_1363420 [compost metagenome]